MKKINRPHSVNTKTMVRARRKLEGDPREIKGTLTLTSHALPHLILQRCLSLPPPAPLDIPQSFPAQIQIHKQQE